ncbi:MAG: alpha/beta fold hydrolase, partial [Desulfobulbaceae bacterium]
MAVNDLSNVTNTFPEGLQMLHFCKPEAEEDSANDLKMLSSAIEQSIPFEGHELKVYRWGSGPKILLVHGWGSRGSHMGFIARNLAKAGYEAIAFDGPAHGRSRKHSEINRSSLPEFCRAIYHLTAILGGIHGIIGHSFGAAAAAFTVAGQAQVAGYRINADKLVLISSPSGVRSMINHYCQNHAFPKGAATNMEKMLESEFPITVAEFELEKAFASIGSEVLVIHDRDDREVPADEIRSVIDLLPNVRYQ